MHYVKHILLPDEKVLFDSHVHPKVLIPGLLILSLAAWILSLASHSGGGHSPLMAFAYWLGSHFPSMGGIYRLLYQWQNMAPASSPEMKILALGIALWGFSRLARGLVLIQSTELVVTDRRIIAKVGLMDIVTLEMDRRRVAGVMVDQTLWGRIMGYGHIYIQGYTSSIGGLPAMVDPHSLEKFINVS